VTGATGIGKRCSVKISVVGVGRVGSVVGFTLATRGLAGEIILCAREGEDEAARASQQRAAMDALDIKHAVAVTSHRLDVRAGTSADTRGSDILVMTASEAMGASLKSRMGLAATNMPALHEDERALLRRSAATVRDAIRLTEHLCSRDRRAAAARKNGRGPARGPVTGHV
jgi:malate/lactate dehydrogenase